FPVEQRLELGGAGGDAAGRAEAGDEDAVAADPQRLGDAAEVVEQAPRPQAQAVEAEQPVDQHDRGSQARDVHAGVRVRGQGSATTMARSPAHDTLSTKGSLTPDP